jgi:hypothetical protein
MRGIKQIIASVLASLIACAPAFADDLGFVVRNGLSSVVNPTAGQTIVFDTSTSKLSVYEGSSEGWRQLSIGKIASGMGRAPTVTDDSSANFTQGSLWFDTSGNAWFCVSNTVTAAVWQQINGLALASQLPSLLTTADILGDWVVSGLLSTTGSGLNCSLPAGVCYVNGVRTVTSTVTQLCTANSDNYFFLTSAGAVSVIAVSHGASQPSGTGLCLQKAVTDATDVTAVTQVASTAPAFKSPATGTAGGGGGGGSVTLTGENIDVPSSGSRTWSSETSGDTVPRVSQLNNGDVQMGPGNASQDVALHRDSSTQMSVRAAGDATYVNFGVQNLIANVGVQTPSTMYNGQAQMLSESTNEMAARNSGNTGYADFKALSLTVPNAVTGGTGVFGGAVSMNGWTDTETLGARQFWGNHSDSSAAASAAVLGLLDVPAVPNTNGFRLTLTGGSPVSDTTGQTTVYLCPYIGDVIGIYNTTLSKWQMIESAQVSDSLSGLTAGTAYREWVTYTSGALVLSHTAWSGSTPPAVTVLNGVRVSSSNSALRWVGDFQYETSGVNDNPGDRGLFNCSNRVERILQAQVTNSSWNYAGSYRAIDANTTNGQGRVSFLYPVQEDAVRASYQTNASINGSGAAATGLALNSSTTPSSMGGFSASTASAGMKSEYIGVPAIGYNFLQAIEWCNATFATFEGINTFGTATLNSGTCGVIRN